MNAYRIVEATSAQELERRVNTLLEEGAVLCGSHHVLDFAARAWPNGSIEHVHKHYQAVMFAVPQKENKADEKV